MENNQNSNYNITDEIYPQAIYRTNYYTPNNISNYSEGIGSNNYYIDPITRQVSNNFIKNYNMKMQNTNMLNEVIESVKNSIMDEAEDEALYNMMLNQAMQEEDKMIISDIANDEKKHNMMLRRIYYSLTGNNAPQTNKNVNIPSNTYYTNLKNSLFGELNAIKKYRKILSEMSDKVNYNMLMEIMTDEITHANKYNYLLAKYLFNKNETKDTVRG